MNVVVLNEQLTSNVPKLRVKCLTQFVRNVYFQCSLNLKCQKKKKKQKTYPRCQAQCLARNRCPKKAC